MFYLPLFHETCKKGFANGDDPTTIVDTFFKKYQARRTKESQINLLFRFIQYIERQVVLFDAIEDAAFPYCKQYGRYWYLEKS